MAESVNFTQSMKKRVVGFFARMLRAIPVRRPQDYAFQGSGTVTWENTRGRVIGIGTKFMTEVKPGDSLKVGACTFIAKMIESDHVLVPIAPTAQFEAQSFKVTPKIDQSAMFQDVQRALKRGECIGIFPEGGSHDRTTLLPLKAGVCLMALGTMARFDVPVTIQCIGLNYFQGHKFRSKAIVNFGVPYTIPRELAELYLKDRATAVDTLLSQIERRLKDVWITAPSYEELNSIFLARSIFKPDDMKPDPSLDFKMNVQFAKAYSVLREKHSTIAEVDQTMKELQIYYQKLRRFGVNDHQVKTAHRAKRVWTSLYILVRVLVSFVVGLPAWVFTLLLGTAVRYLSEKERVRALAASSVKLYGFDVIASFKVVYGLLGYLFLSLMLALCVGLYIWIYYGLRVALNDTLIFLVFWPIYYYISINLTDRSWDSISRVYVSFLSVFSPRHLDLLRQQRSDLKTKITKIVEEYGPQVYPGLNPQKIFKKRSRRDVESLEEGNGPFYDLGL